MRKVNVRFLVNQQTNYGFVMEGQEKPIPKEAADLFVQRAIAEYVVEATTPLEIPDIEVCDPFDTDTMEAVMDEYDPTIKAIDIDTLEPTTIDSSIPVEDPTVTEESSATKPKPRRRGRRKKTTDDK